MARYNRYGRSRRFGFRRRFRRFRTRFRTRYRTIFRNRYKMRYKYIRGRRRSYGGSRRYSFMQWIWKLGVIALLIFGGVYVWNHYLKGKIIKV